MVIVVCYANKIADVDPTSQFIISTGGNRGWEGANTEVLLGYEVVPIL